MGLPSPHRCHPRWEWGPLALCLPPGSGPSDPTPGIGVEEASIVPGHLREWLHVLITHPFALLNSISWMDVP